MDLDEAQLTAEEMMEKSTDYPKNELAGVRTGRASTGLVEFLKVDYYDSPTDLRQLALISVPEPTQLLIKPFDPSTNTLIIKSIQNAGLGLNPIAEGKQILLNLPALTGERRAQLGGAVKQTGEQAKIAIRNARRDGNKHIDAAVKDKTLHLSEDDAEQAKNEIQELVKKYEKQVDQMVEEKLQEINEM